MLNRSCFKANLIRIKRLINFRMTKAYRTVSNEALCVMNGIIHINIKTEETGKYYDITKGKGIRFDRKMAVKYW